MWGDINNGRKKYKLGRYVLALLFCLLAILFSYLYQIRGGSKGENMIKNGDFELGKFHSYWSTQGNCQLVRAEQFSGDYCARIEDDGSLLEQTIRDLKPNTSYALTAYVKSQYRKEPVFLGVKDFGGKEIISSADSTKYTKLTLVFRTGQENRSAKIYIRPSAGGICYVDDLSLTPFREGIQREVLFQAVESAGYAQLPKPPQNYMLPSAYSLVDNTESFINAFKSTTIQNIVLEDGIYINSSVVRAGAAHKIWSRNLGGALLKFGLELRGDGSEVHGLSFEGNGGETMIFIEEKNPNSKILDCYFNGNRTVGKAIEGRETSGLVVKRCVIRDFAEFGIFWQSYFPKYLYDSPEIPPIIEDCDISGIYQPVRGQMNGTGECGLWASTECTVNRVKITDTGWMGLWTGGNCNNALFSNITIDNCYKDDNHSVGIYVEHWTRDSIFQNLQIGPLSGASRPGHRMDIGITTEWDDPDIMPNPVLGQSNGANHNNIFENGQINSRLIGINLEDSENTTIRNIKFKNQRQYAIRDHDSNGTGYTTSLEKGSNDFKDIASGCIEYIQD